MQNMQSGYNSWMQNWLYQKSQSMRIIDQLQLMTIYQNESEKSTIATLIAAVTTNQRKCYSDEDGCWVWREGSKEVQKICLGVVVLLQLEICFDTLNQHLSSLQFHQA